MPTVLTPNQPNQPTDLGADLGTDLEIQPQIRLGNDALHAMTTAIPSPTPPIQPVGSGVESQVGSQVGSENAEPIAPMTSPITSIAGVTELSTNSTDQLLQRLDNAVNDAAQNLVGQLESVSNEQTSLLDKMKKMIEQTGFMESKEVTLNKHIQVIQKLRALIQAQPNQAAEFIATADLPEDVKATLLTAVSHPSNIGPTTTQVNAPQPIPPATPTTPPIGMAPLSPMVATAPQTVTPETATPQTAPETVAVLTSDQVITRLQAQFSQLNPTIQATVVVGAQVYTTPDNGVLVESGGQTIHFSAADLVAANVPYDALRELPQKITNAPAQTVDQVESQMNGQMNSQMNSQAEQNLILKLQNAHLPEVQPLLTNTARVFSSSDNNGVIVMNGQFSQHVSDAQLIQMGATAQDLQGLSSAPATASPTSII